MREKVGNKNNINLIKEISANLKYILYNKREKGEGINPINYLENYEKKIDDYSFLNIAFSMFSPIWNQNLFIYENEIYSKYIIGNNKNSFIFELKILFYDFKEDFLDYNCCCCNKGMPLVLIIYHLFICFLNIGGGIKELRKYFKDLRLFILLLIISSSTL